MKRRLWTYILLLQCFCMQAGFWTTHFAYRDVQQIAVTPTEVFAISSGSVFSVNKQSEQITLWDSSRGLHGVHACVVVYDSEADEVMLCYEDGKIDLISNGRARYVPDLYLKEMTQSKRCNNITFHNGMAYMAMPFGVLVWDVQKRELTDTWIVGAEASEVNVQTVFFDENKVYVQTPAGWMQADTTANLVDYRVWTTASLTEGTPAYAAWQQSLSRAIADGPLTWYAAGSQGVRRSGMGADIYYLPDGPWDNYAYRMSMGGGYLNVVPGGRWATQDMRPGWISRYDGRHWLNISQDDICPLLGCVPGVMDAWDFMQVAVNPQNSDDFFLATYGSGVYEFRANQPYSRHHSGNSTLTNAAGVGVDENHYNRTDFPTFDADGNFWVICASPITDPLHVRTVDEQWHVLPLYSQTGERLLTETPTAFLLDNHDSHYRWLVRGRFPFVALHHDGGTLTDAEDDVTFVRREWVEPNGAPCMFSFIYCGSQDADGTIWIGTDAGVISVGNVQNFTTQDTCFRVHVYGEDGSDVLADERVNAILFDMQDRMWIGTATQGVYVLDADRQTLLAHFSQGNTPMPSNGVLSLAEDRDNQRVYVGTGLGIVAYHENDADALRDPRVPMETYDEDIYAGLMGSWRLHLAYQSVTEVAMSPERVYGLSDGALFSVDKETEELREWNYLSGLNDANVAFIQFDNQTQQLLVVYHNGNIDLLKDNGAIANIPDLKNASLAGLRVPNAVLMHEGKAYMAMPFGIICVNLRKYEITDTYYIGYGSSAVDVLRIGMRHDSIFACTEDSVYAAPMHANLLDYNVWRTRPIALHEDLSALMPQVRKDTVFDGAQRWIAAGEKGIERIDGDNYYHNYLPSGPCRNTPYYIATEGDRLMMVPGGRFAVEYMNPGAIMCYDKDHWWNFTNKQLLTQTNFARIRDLVHVAIDPKDVSHFFVSAYGYGLLEYRSDQIYAHYHVHNSPLWAAAPENPYDYLRTDGVEIDRYGYAWLMVAGNKGDNVMVLAPDGTWAHTAFTQGGSVSYIETPGGIVHDNVRKNVHWFLSCRSVAGIGYIDDNGTPMDMSDDKKVFRTEFVDQYGKSVHPAFMYCMSQDKEGRIWVGTNEGIFTITPTADFLRSNAVHRPIINRTDGSGLADYLMDGQVVRAIAHDGGNRHWFGTTGEGAFLVTYKDDRTSATTCSTLYHFTTNNSPLLSNNILSIGIMPRTGEVFLGSDVGLASFCSDASEGRSDLQSAYAYPNPVRPGFVGNITFIGLMENTLVKVVDEGGNLVYSTRSNGGTAVWDGKNNAGQQVSSGVYRAFCNTEAGEHTIVPVLIIR